MHDILGKSEVYSEHNVDFSIIGASGTKDLFCLQFLSNKPTPYVDKSSSEDGNTNVNLAVGSQIIHECTLFMGKEQLEALYQAIGNQLDK